ncbi:MAG: PaaI family thioesterase [Myxococcota bacterium]|nr:PaaI family thioesterase [Myxococcota bacterium]
MSSLDAGIATLIEKGIVASPFGQLVGLAADAIAEDHVRVRMPYRPEITTVGEMVHGGAIGALVDVAATAAAWACPRATLSARGSTIGLTLNYLAPGLGCELVADARVVQRGGTVSVIEVDVRDPEGMSVSKALVTYRVSFPKEAPNSTSTAAATES